MHCNESILREETEDVFRNLFTNQKHDIERLLCSSRLFDEKSVDRAATRPVTSPIIDRSDVSSTMDKQQQHILQLLRQGQLNQAFEYTLCASDLRLVLFVCEHVRCKELFSIQPCPLQTPVLLSLIQQLSSDLTTHQELKHR
jgi:hypothetical protein